MKLSEARELAKSGAAVAVCRHDAFPNQYRRTLHQLLDLPVTTGVVRKMVRCRHPEEESEHWAAVVEFDTGASDLFLPRSIAGTWPEFSEIRTQHEAAGLFERRGVDAALVLGEGFTVGLPVAGVVRVSASVTSVERVARSLVLARRALTADLDAASLTARKEFRGSLDTLDYLNIVEEQVEKALRWIDEAADVDAPTRARQAVAEADSAPA